MSNEEMLAHAIADELRPWLERIKQLETENIGLRAEFRLLKELALNYRDDKHTPGLTFPGENPLRRIGH
jgi:hypothetical protein